MLYLSDDLADDEKDERKMKKSKKTATNIRETKIKVFGERIEDEKHGNIFSSRNHDEQNVRARILLHRFSQ